MPHYLDTTGGNDAIAGDVRPAGFTPAISFPMDPANTARQDGVTCVGCEQVFGSRKYECSHVVCDTCFRRSDLTFSGAICPLCGMATPLHLVKEIPEVQASPVSEHAVKCSCSDDLAVEFYCFNCDDFYCHNCKEAHGRVKISKDHLLEKLSSAISPPSPSFAMCGYHPEEELSLFCDQCRCMTCQTCMVTTHREHQTGFTPLANVDIQKRLLVVMMENLPQKVNMIRKINDTLTARTGAIEQIRTTAKTDVKNAVEVVVDAMRRKMVELCGEIDQRCEMERRVCEENSKRMRELLLISSYVKRVTAQACEKDTTLGGKSYLHLLHFAFSKLSNVNEATMGMNLDHVSRPILPLTISVNHLLQQVPMLGVFNFHPQRFQAQPIPVAPPRQIPMNVPSQPPAPPSYPTSAQTRFPMPNAMHAQQNSPYQIQVHQAGQPMRIIIPRGAQLPTTGANQGYNSAPYQQNQYIPYPPNQQRPPFIQQTRPFTAVRFSGNSMQQYGYPAPVAPPAYQQRSAVSGQLQVNPNIPQVGLVPTPPANGEVTPTFPATQPVGQSSNGQQNGALQHLLQAIMQQQSADPLRSPQESTTTNPKRGKGAKTGLLGSPSSKSTSGQPRRIAKKTSPKTRRVSKSTSPRTTPAAPVPSSVETIVDAVATNEPAPLGFERELVAQSTSVHLAQSIPVQQALTVAVTENSLVQGAVSDDSAAPQSLGSDLLSPSDGRLIIDESANDSGIENAIAVEILETENGPFIEEVKQERSSSPELVIVSDSDIEMNDECSDDYCFVCGADDGRPVRRCNNVNCGLLFHGNHHVPLFEDSTSDSKSDAKNWVCMYCFDLAAFKISDKDSNSSSNGMTNYELKACEKLLLNLYAFPNSEMFHEPVNTFQCDDQTGPNVDFSLIRQKLADGQYGKGEEMVADLNHLFNNFYTVYKEVEQVRSLVCSVAEAYRRLVLKYLPDLQSHVSLIHLKRAPSETPGDSKRSRKE